MKKKKKHQNGWNVKTPKNHEGNSRKDPLRNPWSILSKLPLLLLHPSWHPPFQLESQMVLGRGCASLPPPSLGWRMWPGCRHLPQLSPWLQRLSWLWTCDLSQSNQNKSQSQTSWGKKLSSTHWRRRKCKARPAAGTPLEVCKGKQPSHLWKGDPKEKTKQNWEACAVLQDQTSPKLWSSGSMSL